MPTSSCGILVDFEGLRPENALSTSTRLCRGGCFARRDVYASGTGNLIVPATGGRTSEDSSLGSTPAFQEEIVGVEQCGMGGALGRIASHEILGFDDRRVMCMRWTAATYCLAGLLLAIGGRADAQQVRLGSDERAPGQSAVIPLDFFGMPQPPVIASFSLTIALDNAFDTMSVSPGADGGNVSLFVDSVDGDRRLSGLVLSGSNIADGEIALLTVPVPASLIEFEVLSTQALFLISTATFAACPTTRQVPVLL